MKKIYTKDEIIILLQTVYDNIRKPITRTIIDTTKELPSHKTFERLFGTWQNACRESHIPFGKEKRIKNTNEKRGYDICAAQQVLDKRNGNFEILTFTTVRAKSKVKCRTCGYEWDVAIYNLYDNNTKFKGCPECFKQHCKNIEKLKEHNVIRIKKLQNGKTRFQCLKCGYEFDLYEGNVTSDNFHCQNCSAIDHKHYKMIKLLDGSLQSLYILGFLLADGHFSDTGRIRLNVKSADKNIVDKIVAFLGIEESIVIDKKSYGFSCMDTYTSQLLKQKYQITSNKTYNPCDISSLCGNELIAFIIGFIDGDGYIGFRTDSNAPKIMIKLHKSWETNLNYISWELYNICNKNKRPKAIHVKQKQGTYALLTFGDKDVLKMLRNFIKEHNLFCLERKWSKLDNII